MDIQLSKTISYVLRHGPQEFEVELDENGWLDIDVLFDALAKHSRFKNVTINDLTTIIKESNKKRFEIQGCKIRAYYGHSIKKKLERQSVVPPIRLFHGTSPEAAKLILDKGHGLLPMDRQHVHLASTIKTAIITGRRKAKYPVILLVNSMAAVGHVKFYEGNEDIWLAEPVPASFITKFLPSEVIISEGINGTWHYHLSFNDCTAISLCGKQTMASNAPRSSWGYQSHLNERYCKDCIDVEKFI